MTETVEVPAGQSEAQRLIQTLAEQSGSIENLVVTFSLKGEAGKVLVGYTGQTPIMWTLGALDHVRWHCYNAMTVIRAQAMHDEDTVDHLKQTKGLN